MPLNGAPVQPNSVYVTVDSRPVGYHWGLVLTGSAHDDAIFHHASNLRGPWLYETREANLESSLSMVCVIRIGAVNDAALAKQTIESVPADGQPSLRTGLPFRCLYWLKDVLVALDAANVICLPMDIDSLEAAMFKEGDTYRATAESGNGATVLNGF